MNEVNVEPVGQIDDSSRDMARIVYILYLCGLAAGVTAIIGVVMAHIYRDQAPDWLKTHYQFLIRTFWIGLLYIVIGGALTIVLVGFLVLLFWVVWLIVRMVKGLGYLEKRQAHPDPTGWLF